VRSLCAAVALSRASYYRGRQGRDPEPETVALRDHMQKIALEFPAYGYRRITAELQRRGWICNHKRVLRLMRQDNLLCLRRRKWFLRTTDSAHPFPVFANLAATLKPTTINQLWVADITYIRLRREFVYLAVVLDAYSRRVVGWALGRSLEAELTLTALRRAVAERSPTPGLVHHSDRGVQYACGAYTALLDEYGMHLDGCVEIEAACYSAPPGWIGRRIRVQWNGAQVRLIDPLTGQLLREHLRQERGRDRSKTKKHREAPLCARSTAARFRAGTKISPPHFNVVHHTLEKAATIWPRETGINRNPAALRSDSRIISSGRSRQRTSGHFFRISTSIDCCTGAC